RTAALRGLDAGFVVGLHFGHPLPSPCPHRSATQTDEVAWLKLARLNCLDLTDVKSFFRIVCLSGMATSPWPDILETLPARLGVSAVVCSVAYALAGLLQHMAAVRDARAVRASC